MPGIDEGFWDQLDARIAATIVRAPRRPMRPQGPLRPARVSRPAPTIEAQADRHHVSDWTGLVETISAAGAAAQVQDERLRERNAAYEVLASDLRRALDDVERYKGLVAQAQAQANALIKAAEDRARVAEERAETAEGWLRRIAEAIESEFAPGSDEAAAIRSSIGRAAVA